MPGQVSQAVAKAEEQRAHVAVLRDSIQAMGSEFERALPAHVGTDRFVRAALTALNVVPKLAECTTSTVIAGLMQAAQLGLEVSDVRGQAYLIPRRNSRTGNMDATFQLGYRGMIDLAARGGITVSVDVIHANDAYDFERGTNARLYHRPTFDDPGEAIAYYAVARFADARRPEFAIMSRGEVEKHRDQFASTRREGDVYGTWVDHFDAMACKTVVRRLLNYLPATVELRQAFAIDVTESEGPTPAPLVAGDDPDIELDITTSATDPTDAIDASASDEEPPPGDEYG